MFNLLKLLKGADAIWCKVFTSKVTELVYFGPVSVPEQCFLYAKLEQTLSHPPSFLSLSFCLIPGEVFVDGPEEVKTLFA